MLTPKPIHSQDGQPQYFPASAIAAAIGGSAKTIHRRAKREGWPKSERGQRVEYIVPRKFRKACRDIIAKPSILRQARTQRELSRAVAVLGFCLEFQRSPGKGIEHALTATVKNFQHLLRFSTRALRQWIYAVERGGLTALVEHKIGRVGRKSARLDRILK